jgi:hypothetical protein
MPYPILENGQHEKEFKQGGRRAGEADRGFERLPDQVVGFDLRWFGRGFAEENCSSGLEELEISEQFRLELN